MDDKNRAELLTSALEFNNRHQVRANLPHQNANAKKKESFPLSEKLDDGRLALTELREQIIQLSQTQPYDFEMIARNRRDEYLVI